MDQPCVLQVTTRRVNIALDVARYVKQDCGISVIAQIMRHALKRSGLCVQQKKKKPLLFDKNIKACLEFVRVYKHWIMND